MSEEKKAPKTEKKPEMKRIAVIRIKGDCKIKKGVVDTLKMLRLYKKNSCVVLPNTVHYIGMIEKIKHVVTWGEIDEKTFQKLLITRGKLPGKQKFTEEYLKQKTKLDLAGFVKEYFAFKKELNDIAGIKLFFKLHPPIKGFESGGVKKPFSLGGVLGYRKEKINDLLIRMI